MTKIWLESGSINCTCCQDIPGCRNIPKEETDPIVEKPHEKIVSMVIHNGVIHIATEYMVMRYVDNKWETILEFKVVS